MIKIIKYNANFKIWSKLSNKKVLKIVRIQVKEISSWSKFANTENKSSTKKSVNLNIILDHFLKSSAWCQCVMIGIIDINDILLYSMNNVSSYTLSTWFIKCLLRVHFTNYLTESGHCLKRERERSHLRSLRRYSTSWSSLEYSNSRWFSLELFDIYLLEYL